MNIIFSYHRDHAGGNEDLCKLVKGLTVCGGDERIGGLNKKVEDGDKLKVCICIYVYVIKNIYQGKKLVKYLATRGNFWILKFVTFPQMKFSILEENQQEIFHQKVHKQDLISSRLSKYCERKKENFPFFFQVQNNLGKRFVIFPKKFLLPQKHCRTISVPIFFFNLS